LFIATQSNQNLKFATGYLQSRYLASYVAKVDEHNRIYVHAIQQDPSKIVVDYKFLHNTKLASSKFHKNAMMQKRKDASKPTGRAVSLMEMIAIILGYRQDHTNINFIHVQSVVLAERPALDYLNRPNKYFNKNDSRDSSMPQDLFLSRDTPVIKVQNEMHNLPI
jgi:hypothetical protein